MDYLKLPLVVLLSICVSGLLAIGPAAAQGQSTALERGYRTGYSDGYTAGYKDVSDGATRDFQNKEDYKKADRSFNDAWGPIEDYRDGYQQGFEAGYTSGYERQQFNSTLPTGLRRRGATTVARVDDGVSTPRNDPPAVSADTQVTPPSGSVVIPRNTILALELLTPLATDVSQRGDRLEAKVIEPVEIAKLVVPVR